MNNFKSSFGRSPFNSGSLDEYKQNNEMNEQNRGLENNNSQWGFSSRFSNSNCVSPFQSLQNRRFGLGDGNLFGSLNSTGQPRSPFGRSLFSNDSPFSNTHSGQWTNASRFNSNNGRINSPFENSTIKSPFGNQSFSNGRYISPFRNALGNFGSLTRMNNYNSQHDPNINNPNSPNKQYGQQPMQQQPYDPYANQSQYGQQPMQQQPYDPYANQSQYGQQPMQQPYNNQYANQQQPYDPYGSQPQYTQPEQQPYDPYGSQPQYTQPEQPYSDPYANQQQYDQQPMQQAVDNDVANNEFSNNNEVIDDTNGNESYKDTVMDSIPDELDEGDSPESSAKAKHALFVWSPEENDWDLVGNFKNLKKAESKKKKMMASKKHDYSDEWFSISPL